MRPNDCCSFDPCHEGRVAGVDQRPRSRGTAPRQGWRTTDATPTLADAGLAPSRATEELEGCMTPVQVLAASDTDLVTGPGASAFPFSRHVSWTATGSMPCPWDLPRKSLPLCHAFAGFPASMHVAADDCRRGEALGARTAAPRSGFSAGQHAPALRQPHSHHHPSDRRSCWAATSLWVRRFDRAVDDLWSCRASRRRDGSPDRSRIADPSREIAWCPAGCAMQPRTTSLSAPYPRSIASSHPASRRPAEMLAAALGYRARQCGGKSPGRPTGMFSWSAKGGRVIQLQRAAARETWRNVPSRWIEATRGHWHSSGTSAASCSAPEEACALHERAISLNPNLPLAWCFSGVANSYLGRHEEAIERIAQAQQLSPHDPHAFFFDMALMMPHLLRGEFETVVTLGRRAIELNPSFSSTYKGYLAALGHLGRDAERRAGAGPAASARTELLSQGCR